ncbi:MAG: DUF814 domain-containing protein [Cytophagales bacterium]|nr:MAG: DUF814 domain-containing protein [Cytophagales bacterium]
MENTILDYQTATSFETIQKIGTILRQKLLNKILIECFSQNKDELMLGFGDSNEDFWIKANFDSDIALMCFPNDFTRSKKNTVTIFNDLLNLKVIALEQHQSERSFHLVFENDFKLMFKLHGKNSNLIYFKNNKLIDIFKHNLERDYSLKINDFIIDNEKFIENNILINYTNFYHSFSYNFYLNKEKKQALQKLGTKINTTQKYIETASEKFINLETTTNYKQIADILMANIHLSNSHSENIELYNFYINKTIFIKVKPEISLLKNAENYYRKSKNQKIELLKIKENIERKQNDLVLFLAQKYEIEQASEVKNIRKYVDTNKILVPKQQIQTILPYTEYVFEGYKIWIGKNAQQNDILTLKFAQKDDLWLHAKDCPGSHVILKNQAGRNFPKNVLEKAASIAAWYSKKKTEGVVSVIFTPKKFVRKIKGSAPGSVVVEQEKVILVAPKNYELSL